MEQIVAVDRDLEDAVTSYLVFFLLETIRRDKFTEESGHQVQHVRCRLIYLRVEPDLNQNDTVKSKKFKARLDSYLHGLWRNGI